MKNTLLAKNVAAMKGYVPGEQPSDRNVVKLNTNENPYPPSPKVLKALQKITGEDLRRYPDPACNKLRLFIAGKFGCSEECVFVGNGSDEILALAAKAFVENDGIIGYVEPSYSLYPVVAQIRGVKTRPIYADKNFRWDIPEDYKVSLFYLTNPNAPSGVQYELEFVKKFCKKMAGGVVLIDEAYVDFASENAFKLAFEFKNVLVMRTLSKSYSLAGLRLGFVFGNKQLISALFKIKDSYNVDAVAQHLAIAAIKDGNYTKKMVNAVIAERDKLVFSLKALGFEVLPSSTNFIFARPPEPIGAEFLFEELKKRKIFVRYFPGKITGAGIRISVGTPKQMKVLIDTLKEICIFKKGKVCL
jgi:histidinol-phosphate aminotransferase